jgi:2-polyprenyl-3-methyl-5-hydroxy-6-metoxy-1,4-benzoquinol methylase
MTPDINNRWLHDFTAYAFRRIPENPKSILDVGTGRGVYGALIEPMFGFKPDGIEIYKPYADYAEKFYRKLWVGNALTVLMSLATDRYTAAICFEMIEHLSDIDAHAVIRQLERVAQTVIISSPNQFRQQRDYDSNPYQQHMCLVSAHYMRKRGYTVRGVGRLSWRHGDLVRLVFPSLDEGWLAWKHQTQM